jgi:hypothetical protein
MRRMKARARTNGSCSIVHDATGNLSSADNIIQFIGNSCRNTPGLVWHLLLAPVHRVGR